MIQIALANNPYLGANSKEIAKNKPCISTMQAAVEARAPKLMPNWKLIQIPSQVETSAEPTAISIMRSKRSLHK